MNYETQMTKELTAKALILEVETSLDLIQQATVLVDPDTVAEIDHEIKGIRENLSLLLTLTQHK